MKLNDMVLVSADDHIIEPPTMFDNQLSGELLKSAPKLLTASNGADYWSYEGQKMSSIALGAVVGRPPEEYGMEPTALSQLRKGCYDPVARLEDMNANGIAASLNFSSFCGLDGAVYYAAQDKKVGQRHMQAHNDYVVDEWCGTDRGRFIPIGMLPLWDMDESVAEVKRLAAKGCHTVSISDDPTQRGLPSVHNQYWEPLWRALTDAGTAVCLHIGQGHPPPHASMETPIEAWITTMPMSISIGAADWLNLAALHRYPSLRIVLSEGSIGWIPYFTERADFSHQQHHAWTHSNHYYGEMKPSDVFKRHFLNCFIDDKFGLHNIEFIGEDNIAYECDYPHSDTLWPKSPEALHPTLAHLTDEQIDKITHGNSLRDLNFDLFGHYKREEINVGALRAKAREQNVDISQKSQKGATPLMTDELPRPITSGDVLGMFANAEKEVA